VGRVANGKVFYCLEEDAACLVVITFGKDLTDSLHVTTQYGDYDEITEKISFDFDIKDVKFFRFKYTIVYSIEMSLDLLSYYLFQLCETSESAAVC